MLWNHHFCYGRNLFLFSCPLYSVLLINCCFCCCCLAVQQSPTLGNLPPQSPLSLEFSRQEYWSGLPRPPLWDLPSPGLEPWSLPLQADSGSCTTREALAVSVMSKISIRVNSGHKVC